MKASLRVFGSIIFSVWLAAAVAGCATNKNASGLDFPQMRWSEIETNAP